ncbi:MAG TPA: ATP-binding cassette domain-containing protein, partial [Devosia sp.]|nr:ATP-binding cassette domain-containing protein [Devosia sp.]
YNPLRLLASHYHDRAAAKAAIGEIEAQLGELPADAAPLQDAPLGGHSHAMGLQLVGVSLRTPDSNRIILDRAELTIMPGEHVAVIGPSGTGKSTLLEAVARLRQAEGPILLDQRPLADWPEGELRSRMTMLGQKPRIFAASLAQNIALARPGSTPAEISRAAELAHVSEFADSLPKGLETMLGEGGLGVSGGQAQRIALARIYLRDAGLILLDEPTAHMDAALEQAVMDDLQRYARGRTLLIATHSLAVAARMDRAWQIAGQALVPAPLLPLHQMGEQA